MSSYPGVPGEQVSRAALSRRKGEEERVGVGRGEEGGSSLTDIKRESQSVFTVQKHGSHLNLPTKKNSMVTWACFKGSWTLPGIV